MYLRTVLLACCLAASASTSQTFAAPVPSTASRPAAPEASPGALNPDLKYPTLATYEKAISEPGLVLDSPYVCLFAPKRKAAEANIIFPYLVKAYDELYKIVGVHTRYRIVVYHFPNGHPDGRGNTSNCTIRYTYDNLDLTSQSEWKNHKVPHVSGYIEEMAHNFVDGTHAQFGWEMIGWTIGIKVSQKVAGNPALARDVEETRKGQSRTYQRYVKAGYIFPQDMKANQCDRIHAWILHLAEMQYGPNFWPDFFARIRQQREALADAVQLHDDDAIRNARYRITVDCFDNLDKIRFKDALRQARISLTTDVNTLRPTDPQWDHRFVAPGER